MKDVRHFLAVSRAAIAGSVLSICLMPAALAASVEQQRADAWKMSQQTLERLYKAQPAARSVVQKAAGYAVFSAMGTKILLVGGGMGSGVAVDNRSGKPVYMKMAEAQAGLGLGVKKFHLVWVFENKKDLDTFINTGWELGGQASASAKLGSQGAAYTGAMSIKPGVWLYQLIDDGLAAELTAKGTRYYKDNDLN